MTTLKKLLDNYQRDIINSISAGRGSRQLSDKNEVLIKGLKLISRRNKMILWITISMLLLVFAGNIFLIYHFADKPATLIKMYSASGFLILGIIYGMIHLWKQVVAIDLVIMLYDRLDSNALGAIIQSLASTLKISIKGH